MADSRQLLNTLKRQLRSQNIRYARVAEHLGLSEASIKRMFASGQLSLPRLEKICALVSWDLVDLAKAADANVSRVDQLSDDQEREIAADIALLLVAVSVINGYSFDDIVEQFTLTEHECIRKLAKLDKLNLIELLPGNRIKLKISRNFRWNPRGPIQRFFLDKVVDQFFHSDFAKSNEKLIVMNGMLSPADNHAFQLAMQKFAESFSNIAQDKTAEGIKGREGCTMVLALRAWRFSLFQPFAKP